MSRRRLVLPVAVASAAAGLFATAGVAQSTPVLTAPKAAASARPWMNAELTPAQRAQLLLKQMTGKRST